ncbi:cbb3-type cytochrome c oxidase subunit I [Phaeobacter gallaeciensis]|uniref:Cytochrome c oxidase subunit 1 n=1 Tax=Phaeobacter gallaeciensis TaxID=60890 RepID=A0AAC9Z7K7_9RHOB|nr:cbb3-type cytochrome c oxidase subunit I [Phaeobacter gallaeciensis]AHD08904.1 Heme/copper-type cytochrome/quinol oxidase, subunit 1 [Phaeobacter gallaeciensis DSM 26640]ATE92170.1 putative cytochrome c oxidase subunit 1 [Phaeobacter gallaeciensis]ATE98011.1 putative cytochrome c oxidase subunit 1 [Phaeobacter gallaeciensis]ATF00832.1 putative cytochrome c oxidase subunit 1 [Phaeobacter gallaeciensis]ATF05212.1 putative cytochrome c oxidase subunit 1 [Phaeobacter gallaeciensis]
MSTASEQIADAPAAAAPQAGAVKLTMILSGAVFALMMVLGLIMRAAQGQWIELDPALFYQILTAHGAGMVGTAALSGAAIMWYFCGRHLVLTAGIFWAFLGLFLLGVVLILSAIFVGGYGGAWTFLFPLPALSGGAWEAGAAAAFMLGYVSIGVGFLLYYLELGRQIHARYGSLARALGWNLILGREDKNPPPPTIVAAAAVTIFNSIGIILGAAVLVASLVHLLVPGFEVNALLAKNLIYFFGHVFINASIYMAVTAVYEILPEYTGKAWKSNRMFAIAWNAVLIFVMAVYWHHLLQDVVMPPWMLVVGQLVSYFSGIPLIAVTAFSTFLYVRGSKMTWDLASSLLVLSVAGWSVGSIPASIDGMISVNKVMHNTMWVPGHFHTYLLLGEVAMAFGFMAWLVRGKTISQMGGLDCAAFVTYLAGAAGFVTVFLFSGAASIPRRWAVHYEEWLTHDRIGTLFSVLVVLGTLIFVLRFVARLGRSES